MNTKDIVPEMTDERIINYWKTGFTVQQISKEYVRSNKQRGIRVKLLDAQKYVEPIIFKYQTELMKG